jgi:glycosyltransferase involved in cell wall biosynthesis
MTSRRYCLITPCRDEAGHIRATLGSIARQTLPPAAWIIVDDGSRDETPRILAEHAALFPYVRVLRRESGERAVGPGVVTAFDYGLAQVRLADFDYVCKLDGDLEMAPRYFERAMEWMEADPCLGSFSGKLFERRPDGRLIEERTGDEAAVGPAKLYRVGCFESIGGFVRAAGWDVIDGHLCRINDWIALSAHDPELQIVHLRRMGSSQRSVWVGRQRWGGGKYFAGSAWYYMAAASLYRAFQRPWVIGGAGIALGYARAAAAGDHRFGDVRYRRYVRRYEWQSLLLGKRSTLRRYNEAIRARRLAALSPAARESIVARSVGRFPKLATLGLLLLGSVTGLAAAEAWARAFLRVRIVGPSLSVYDARYGKRLKASFAALRQTPEATWRFTTNSLGFRGPEPRAPPRHGILFLGDSFTEGYGVDDGLEFPALVKKALDAREGPDSVPVVNAGLGDSGNGRWLRFLQAQAGDLAPRVVVLQFCGNDVRDNAREGLYGLGDAGALVEMPVPPPGFGRLAQTVVDVVPPLSRSHLVGLVRELAWVRSSGAGAPRSRVPTASSRDTQGLDEQLTLRIVAEVLTFCARSRQPVLALLVDADGVLPARLDELLAAHGAAIVRLPDRHLRPDLYFRIDGHWNAAGHREAAARVLAALEAEPFRGALHGNRDEDPRRRAGLR